MITIVGCGAAGSYLAYLLAKRGKDVTIIEEHKKIGSPVQCTGIVTSSIENFIKLRKGIVANRLNKVIVLRELEDLKTNLVSKREFYRAKNLLLAVNDDNLENIIRRAVMLSDFYFKHAIFDPRNYKKQIGKISREAIRRTAQKYFSDKYTLTALVPENFKK